MSDETKPPYRVEVELLDGRIIDLTGRSIDELLSLGITPGMIRETRHFIPPIASIACPRCGMVSYNPKDIIERYCGNCHQFHEFLPPPPIEEK